MKSKGSAGRGVHTGVLTCYYYYYATVLQALQQGNNDGARIYASNAIRKKSESLNLLRLASRIDAVASRVETATTMRQVTGNMTSVVKGMDKAMETMNLERVRPLPSLIYEKFCWLNMTDGWLVGWLVG